MLQTLFKIGEAIKDDPEYEQYFQPWGNPFPGREEKAKVLIIEIKNGQFNDISLEVYRSKTFLAKYLYWDYSYFEGANGKSITPTYKLFLKEIDKALTSTLNKLRKTIESYDYSSIKGLIDDFPKIEKEIKDKVKDIDNDVPLLLTLRIDNNYIGDYTEDEKIVFLQNLREYGYNGYKEKKKKISAHNNQECSITQDNGEVWGYFKPLGFTVDKDAFMRGGFDRSTSYKMFPVSPEAVKVIDGMRNIVFTQVFSHTFHKTIKYLILPKFIGDKNEIIKEVFKLFEKKQPLNLYTDQDEKGTKGFINRNETIIEEITEEDDLHRQDILYDILFFEDNKSQLSLIMQLTDVRPSRLNRIMEVKISTEKFYKNLTNSINGNYRFYINLVAIQNYLLTGQEKSETTHPYFFKLTEAIFYGQKVDKATFIRFLLIKFRKAFKDLQNNQYGLQTAVKEGFTILRFLEHLNIFSNQNLKNMEQTDEKIKLDAISFIDQHSDFFTSNYKKGAFLFGCLVTRLMYNQPGNAFLKELNDLSIDKALIEKKFPKLIAKLRQYGQEFRELEQAAANHFTDHDKISKDDISFAVSLGLILQKEFDVRNKKIKQVETELGTKHEIVEP